MRFSIHNIQVRTDRLVPVKWVIEINTTTITCKPTIDFMTLRLNINILVIRYSAIPVRKPLAEDEEASRTPCVMQPPICVATDVVLFEEYVESRVERLP